MKISQAAKWRSVSWEINIFPQRNKVQIIFNKQSVRAYYMRELYLRSNAV